MGAFLFWERLSMEKEHTFMVGSQMMDGSGQVVYSITQSQGRANSPGII